MTLAINKLRALAEMERELLASVDNDAFDRPLVRDELEHLAAIGWPTADELAEVGVKARDVALHLQARLTRTGDHFDRHYHFVSRTGHTDEHRQQVEALFRKIHAAIESCAD